MPRTYGSTENSSTPRSSTRSVQQATELMHVAGGATDSTVDEQSPAGVSGVDNTGATYAALNDTASVDSVSAAASQHIPSTPKADTKSALPPGTDFNLDAVVADAGRVLADLKEGDQIGALPLVQPDLDPEPELQTRTHFQSFTQRVTQSWFFETRAVISDLLKSTEEKAQHVTCGATDPLDNLKTRVWKQTLLLNSDFLWNKLWPLAFLGISLHDVLEFLSKPHARYTNTTSKLLWGLMLADRDEYSHLGATNQLTWSNNFGSDLVDRNLFWVGPEIFIGGSVLYRFAQGIYQRYCLPLALKPEEIANINEQQDFQYQITVSLTGKSSLNISRTEIDRVEFAIRFDPRLKISQREALIDLLMNLAAPRNNFWTRQAALNSLSRIALSFSERGLKMNLEKAEEKPGQGASLRIELLNKIVAVENFLNAQPALPLTTQYNLWSQGKNQHAKWHLLFWPMFLWQQFSKMRLLEVLLQKIRSAIEYVEVKQACEADDKTYSYREPTAQYDCSVCPDWEEVYYKNSYTAQGCLNDLFAQKRSLETILTKLKTGNVLSHADEITIIDLSKQDIAAWLEKDYAELLKLFQDKGIKHLEKLDLSAPHPATQWKQDQKANSTAEFLQGVKVDDFVMRDQGMTSDQVQVIWQGAQNQTFYRFDLSGNAVGDEMLNVMGADIGSGRVNVSSLGLANATITDFGVANGATTALQNPLLWKINLASNLFGDSGCSSFAPAMAFSHLQELILDSNPLTSVCFSALGTAITTTPFLRKLSTQNCGVDDIAIQSFVFSLPLSHITEWIVAQNVFTDTGFVLIMYGAQGSPLKRLDVSNNAITDLGFSTGTPYVANTNLTALIVGDTQVTPSSLVPFVQVIPNTTLSEIDFAGLNLGGTGFIPYCFGFFANNTHSVQRIGLDRTNLVDVDGVAIARNLNGTGTTHLSVNDDFFTNVTGFAFADSFAAGNQLRVFYAQHCGLGTSVQTILMRIPGTKLQTADFSRNTVVNLQAMKSFITPLPEDQLGLPVPSIDFRRALADAKPTTELTRLVLPCEQLAAGDVNIAHHVWQQSDADFDDLILQNCQTSGATRLQPWTTTILSLAPAFLTELPQLAQSVFQKITHNAQQLLPTPQKVVDALVTTTDQHKQPQSSVSAHLILTALALFIAYILYRAMNRMHSLWNNRQQFFAGAAQPTACNQLEDRSRALPTFSKH